MEEKEIWKDIEGFEGMYQVSNMGRVKSLERTVWNNRGYYRTLHEKIRKPVDNGYGYLQVKLHKDEDKTNNNADNLEWCSRSYNCNYGTRSKKIGEKLGKPVIAIDVRTGLKLEFVSSREAERETGISHGNIIQCCKGKLNSCGGFYWMYADADAE